MRNRSNKRLSGVEKTARRYVQLPYPVSRHVSRHVAHKASTAWITWHVHIPGVCSYQHVTSIWTVKFKRLLNLLHTSSLLVIQVVRTDNIILHVRMLFFVNQSLFLIAFLTSLHHILFNISYPKPTCAILLFFQHFVFEVADGQSHPPNLNNLKKLTLLILIIIVVIIITVINHCYSCIIIMILINTSIIV